MEILNGESMHEPFEEEWSVVLSNGGKYTLSQKQALILQEAIAAGNRGILMFKTFSISVPFVVEFYLSRKYVVGQKLLPAEASEDPWTEEDRLRAIENIKKLKEKYDELKKKRTL